MANADRLWRVYDRIADDPGSWDNDNWARRWGCHTTYCVAGHAMILAGDPPDLDSLTSVIVVKGDDVDEIRSVGYTVSGALISTAASRWLDLTPNEVERLFYANVRSVVDLRRIVEDVAGDRTKITVSD